VPSRDLVNSPLFLLEMIALPVLLRQFRPFMPTPTPFITRFWYLPLALAIIPAWMALHLTSPVPRADHWIMFVEPYFSWLDGQSFWSLIHEQGNDSRYDTARLVSFFLMRFAHWNLNLESLICVLIATGTVGMLLWLLRRIRPGGDLPSWGLGWLCAALLLTPHQWMNWTFSVQTCYAFVVFGTFGVLASFNTNLQLWLRALLAAAFAFLACHSFFNGWLAWELGILYLAWEGWNRGWRNREWLGAVAIFMGALTITAFVYFTGFGTTQGNPNDVPVLQRIMQNPRSFIIFFMNLLGAPFSEGWATWERPTRFVLNDTIAPVIGTFTLLLALAAAVGGLRQWRGHGSIIIPFVLMILWGLENAAAITLGRTGMANFTAFQSRYPAYTLWLHIGLLGLLFMLNGHAWKWTRRLWLVVVIYGYSISFVQGWRDGQRDFHRNQIMAAAASFRHIAPDSALLGGLFSGTGLGVIPKLDRLEKIHCLNLATVRSELVADTPRAADDIFSGELKKSGFENGQLSLRGWALKRKSNDLVDAVIISTQVEGEAEKWFALATDRLREPKVCAKLRIAPFEQRLGWGYPSREAGSHILQTPARSKPLPTGRVTFRAYAFDVFTGEVAPLKGEITTAIPAS
jgi:hypothetical protein